MSKQKLCSVSIIVPTYNRKASLKSTLASLADIDYPDNRCEVVVIDDGSTDGTEEMIKSIKKNYPFPIAYSKQEKKGIPSARNSGIADAKGNILVFTDDDCTFDKNWLKHVVKHFDAPKVGAVGVPDMNPKEDSFFARCVDYTINSLVGAGGVRRKNGMRIARYYPRAFGMAIPKAVIEKVGGFDESLFAGEDIELSYKIRKAGYLLKYEPRAIVWHKRRNTLSGFSKQILTRGYTRIELARRHIGLLEPAYALPLFMIVGFVALTGLSFLTQFSSRILLTIVALYLSVIIISGVCGTIKIKDARALIVLPFILSIQHLMYGLGLLRALGNLIHKRG